jgi:hypothetical protein
MATELDRIKSTITISFGTKNRLRALKGSYSYEEYINHLIRSRNKTAQEENMIELQKFTKKQAIHTTGRYKILFEYNQFSSSPNFIFDIKINIIREEGKIIPLGEFLTISAQKKDLRDREYSIYFELLQTAIQKEIEPLFKHNGRFEDHFSWQKEFEMLNLPKRAFEEDVMDKLNSYRYGEMIF